MPTVFIEEIGQTVRFPDDMSNDEIGRVIQSEILPQYQQQTTTTTSTPDPILSREEEIDKRQEDRSFLDTFTTGFKRSLRGTKDIFLEGGIRSLAEKTIGRDEEAKKYAEKYDQALQKMEEELPATIPSWKKDVKNAEDFADYMLNNTGYFVGEIAQIGLGTVTGAIARTTAGTRQLGAQAAAEQIGETNKEIQRSFTPTPNVIAPVQSSSIGDINITQPQQNLATTAAFNPNPKTQELAKQLQGRN